VVVGATTNDGPTSMAAAPTRHRCFDCPGGLECRDQRADSGGCWVGLLDAVGPSSSRGWVGRAARRRRELALSALTCCEASSSKIQHQLKYQRRRSILCQEAMSTGS
jgi:hypothetical protein